jgi:hypothetical protein
VVRVVRVFIKTIWKLGRGNAKNRMREICKKVFENYPDHLTTLTTRF